MNNDKTIKTKDKTVKNKILLIDDKMDACLTFKNMLDENGFDTNAYDKPLDALHNFKSGIYDLVVLDIKIPSPQEYEKKRDKVIELLTKIKDEDALMSLSYLNDFLKLDENLPRAYVVGRMMNEDILEYGLLPHK